MEFLLPLLPLAFAALGLSLGFVQRHRRVRAWQDALRACGLQVTEPPGWSRQLTARAGPVAVKIETCGNKGRLTRITVWIPGPPDFHSLRIRREPLVRWGREIEIGDKAFDEMFFIEGPPRLVLALLDAETRRLLIQANTVSRLEISNGTLRAENMADRMVPYVLPLLLNIAHRFVQPMDVLRRLTENATRDPEPGVRLQNLSLLIRELPDNPWTVEALRTACSDKNLEVRLLAARNLGAEGRGVLLDLAESLEDDAVSAKAVAALGRELPLERTRALLSNALRRRCLQSARTCLEALGQNGNAEDVDLLAKVMELEQGELATAAAQALGGTGRGLSARAEPPLILALQREQPADLRAAAAQALGRIGSVAAVLPLKEAAESSWLDLDLRRAARQAIAEIQSRLSGASPGQLSLASSEAGQLSLAQDGDGRLSLAIDPAGQLSLPPREPKQPGQPV
jgi:hypothetical protein